MYFINYSKCNSCNQKKSVASSKTDRNRRCIDCDRQFYLKVSENQKSLWINNSKG